MGLKLKRYKFFFEEFAKKGRAYQPDQTQYLYQSNKLPMDDEIYKRAKELHQKTRHFSSSSRLTNDISASDFEQFLRLMLKRYIDATDALRLLRTQFVEKASDGQQRTWQLLRRLEEATGDKRCSDNIRYYLGVEQEARKLVAINEALAQLKYYQFESVGQYQPDLVEKVKRVVGAVNVYESYLISLSAEQLTGKLKGSELEAYEYYRRHNYNFVPTMASALCSIAKYKEELNILKQDCKRAAQGRSSNQRVPDSLQDCREVLREALAYRKDLEQVPKLLENMIPYLEMRKEIPSKYSLAPDLKDQAIIDSFNNLCLAIRKSYASSSHNSNSSSHNVTITYGRSPYPHDTHQPYYPNYQELIKFVDRLFKKLEKPQPSVSFAQKMDQIQLQLCSSSSYSVSIIQEVTSYAQPLNQLISNCITYFRLHKDPASPSFTFSFSVGDIQNTNRIVSQLLSGHSRESLSASRHENMRLRQELQKQKAQIYEATSALNIISTNLTKLISSKRQVLPPENYPLLTDKLKHLQFVCTHLVQELQEFRALRKNKHDSGEFQLLGPEEGESGDSALLKGKAHVGQGRAADLSRSEHEVIRKLQQQNAFCRTKIQEMSLQLQQLRQKCRQKDSELSQQESDLAKLLESLKSENRAEVQGQETKAEQRRVCEENKTEIQDLNHRLHLVQVENETNCEERFRLQNALEELSLAKEKEVELLRRTHEKQVDELRRAQAKNQQAIDLLTSQLNQATEVNSRLVEENANLKADNEQINLRFTEHIAEDLNRTIESIDRDNSAPQYEPEVEPQPEIAQKQVEDLYQKYRQQTEQLIADLQLSNSSLQGELSALRQQLQKSEQLYSNAKIENQSLKDRASQLTRAIETMEQEERRNKLRIAELQDANQAIKAQAYKAHQQPECLYRSPVHVSALPALVPYTELLFNHDIFSGDNTSKLRLLHHLQAYASRRVKATRLLYTSDPRNKANFHLYLDGVKNLTLVVRTSSALIAGFYPGVYRDKEIMDKGGLLVSMTGDERFELRSNTEDKKAMFRGMIYDSYFVIFGNAEIRVRIGYKTVFSNFGINNGFFNAGGRKVEDFLKEGDKREVEFVSYEFYQLFFEGQEDIALAKQ